MSEIFERILKEKQDEIDRLKAREATSTNEWAGAEPVAAQHRFRHPQKNMPGWSVWQPCAVSDRPKWEVDSQGYEVEYRNLYTHPPARVPNWIRAIDEELVGTFIGVANVSDTYEVAKKKLGELIDWHVQVAIDPAVNGGYVLVPARVPLTDQQIVDLCDGTLTTWEQVRIARAIEQAHGIGASTSAQQTCNCRWDGEKQVQQCTLHVAHVEAIHEWAERAKTAEKELAAQQPLQTPLTDEEIEDVWNFLVAKYIEDVDHAYWSRCDFEFARAIEAAHGIGGGK